MRNMLILVSVLLGLGALTYGVSAFLNRPQQSATVFPDFTYTRLDGGTATFHGLKGKPVVVHFWATWCPPCVDELPALIDKAALRPDVMFMLISVDKDQGLIRRFLHAYEKKLQADNIILVHDADMTLAKSRFSVTGFPESFFFNSELYRTNHIRGPIKWVSFTRL